MTENCPCTGEQGPQMVKAAPIGSDCESKDCAFWPDPIAVFRIIPNVENNVTFKQRENCRQIA